MATFGLGLVPSPPAEPPSVGLIPSLIGTPYLVDDDGMRTPDGADVRWADGVRYNPEQTCSFSAVFDPCNPGTKVTPANPGMVEAVPWGVVAGDKCSTFGWSARDYKARATRALLAAESKMIAKEFWRGDQAKTSGWPNRYLANPSSDTLTNGPITPAQALGYLEQYIGDCGTGVRGAIHCTRQLGIIWSELGNTFRTAGGMILTYMNTIIIPDAGYDGSGPNGEPRVDGSQWAYVTQVPIVRRSPSQLFPDTFEEAMIVGTNDLEFRAERLAVATFPLCCHGAVEVNLPLPLEGGAS